MKRALYLWPIWRVAREARVRPSSVYAYSQGRLLSGFAMHRIEEALNILNQKGNWE